MAHEDQEPVRETAPVSGLLVVHLGEQVHDHVQKWIRHFAGRDPYWYDVSLVVLPTQPISIAYALTLFAPSPIIGHRALGSAQIMTDFPDEPEIKSKVLAAVAEIRQLRKHILRQGNGNAFGLQTRPVKDHPQA